MLRKSVFFFMMLGLVSCQPATNDVKLSAPSGDLEISIHLNDAGALTYQLDKTMSGETITIIEESSMGISRADADFTKDMKITAVSAPVKISDEYSMISGKYSYLEYTANQRTVQLENADGKKLELLLRVFDNGAAFRYRFPGDGDNSYTVLSETTSFNVGPGVESYMSAYQAAKSWGNPGYENDYLMVESGTPSTEGVGWAFPLLFKKNGQWIFISEADLDASYCGTHLAHDCSGGNYRITFPEANERLGDGQVNPSSELPWEMPWRFIIVEDSPEKIAESSMVYHLSDPCKLDNTSWIKPGRASWEWWSSKGGRTVKRLNRFVDLAAEMGWEYSLVDAGWQNMPDGTIEDVIAYADKKDVGLLFWYSSGGRRDSTRSNSEFVMFNEDTRKAEMAKLEAWGVKGIKVDFFATDKQMAIKLYEDIIRDAAKHHLLVNFHGCTMPRGWTRTYPNLIAMEAVRGAEAYRFSETYPEITAEYNTIAAVVRGTAGPTDFTPATFSDNRYPHLTTYGHELALTVVYESGIIHMADTPESYFSLPSEAIDFLKAVPAAWDESRLLYAVPGEAFVVARRKGNHWIVAGINGLNENQSVSFNLKASPKGSVLIADGDHPQELKILNINEEGKAFTVDMAPYGGFVIF